MKLLQEYKSIGWDFDETLVYHDFSEAMWDYILRNPYDQTHHIVTFRSGGMEKRIFDELKLQGSKLKRRHFGKVLNIDHLLWSDYTKKAADKTIILLDDPRAIKYLHWKGEVCNEHGIEVLIDDMTDSVISGCEKHGVVHIHPDDLGVD